MLTLYRRHVKSCSYAEKGRRYRRCQCPIWVQGTLAGAQFRRALDLTSWEAATDQVREWESRGSVSAELIRIEEAVRRFLSDARARHVKESTIKNLQVLLEKDLVPWAEASGYWYLKELGIGQLRDEFRAAWKHSAVTQQKKLERLRSFFRFAKESGWIKENPALAIRSASATKEQIALRIGEMFPEIKRQAPPKRKPWMSEDERMNLFDAVALGVTARAEMGQARAA